MWRNEHEIEELCDRIVQHTHSPELKAYAGVLARWVAVVNSNSDGWCYWRTGARAGEKLSDLLAAAAPAYYESRPAVVPTTAELRKALVPMKSLVTRKNLTGMWF